MRRQLASNAQARVLRKHISEQYLELPRSNCTPTGAPHKGKKVMLLIFLETRYKNIIVSMVPRGWVANSAVMEGMFLSPLIIHRSMMDYLCF